MKYVLILTLLTFALSCNIKEKTNNTKFDDSVNQASVLDTVQSLPIIESPKKSLIDSLLVIVPLSYSQDFTLDKDSDDSIVPSLIRMGLEEKKVFYNSEELKKLHEYYYFESYYFGTLKPVNGHTPILIFNTDWESAIYLDFFLTNNEGAITDMFHLAYLELEILYKFKASSSIVTDSTIIQTSTSEVAQDMDGKLTIRDSSITRYSISESGIIKTKEMYYHSDTLINE